MKIPFFKNRIGKAGAKGNETGKSMLPAHGSIDEKIQEELWRKITILNGYALKGLIAYNTKENRVAIADSIYALFCHNEKKLNNFMKSVLMWINAEESNRAGLRLTAEQRRDPKIHNKVNIDSMEVVVVSSAKLETLVVGQFKDDKFVITA